MSASYEFKDHGVEVVLIVGPATRSRRARQVRNFSFMITIDGTANTHTTFIIWPRLRSLQDWQALARGDLGAAAQNIGTTMLIAQVLGAELYYILSTTTGHRFAGTPASGSAMAAVPVSRLRPALASAVAKAAELRLLIASPVVAPTTPIALPMAGIVGL